MYVPANTRQKLVAGPRFCCSFSDSIAQTVGGKYLKKCLSQVSGSEAIAGLTDDTLFQCQYQ